jgi:hypothetical protein
MYFCPLETSRSTLLPKAPCLLRYSLRAKSASSVSPQNVKILSTESRKFAACASLKKPTGFPYMGVQNLALSGVAGFGDQKAVDDDVLDQIVCDLRAG